jgi:two-component system nitrate/nitrite response regulator NarL
VSRPRVTVIVADDHPVYRRGLARTIAERPDLELLGEAADGREALALVEEHDPDVAVLDISMPELDGVQVSRALQRDARRTAVMLLTGSAQVEGMYGAIAAGASGYLLKTSDPDEICDAIAALARGETVFSPELHASLALDIRARERDDRPLLSPRELEVLRLTAAGANAAEIAGRLHLSVATVRSHIQHGYQKLEVSDRAAAVAKAMRLGLIE